MKTASIVYVVICPYCLRDVVRGFPWRLPLGENVRCRGCNAEFHIPVQAPHAP